MLEAPVAGGAATLKAMDLAVAGDANGRVAGKLQCGSPEGGGSLDSGSDGRLAPRAAAPLAPPLASLLDSASDGTNGSPTGTPDWHQMEQQELWKAQAGSASARRSKRKAMGEPSRPGLPSDSIQPVASLGGRPGSHAAAGNRMQAAAAQTPSAEQGLQLPPASQPSTLPNKLAKMVPVGGHPSLPLHLPGLDDLDDVPGLDDLLIGMTADEDVLLGDPFAGSLPALGSPWEAPDPFESLPLPQQGAAAGQRLRSPVDKLQQEAAAAQLAPLQQQQQQGSAGLQQGHPGSLLLSAVLGGGGHLQGSLLGDPRPPGQHLRGSSAALQLPSLMVPQPGPPPQLPLPSQQQLLQPQQLAEAEDMDRSGSAETQRSHTSLDLAVTAQNPVGNKAGSGGSTRRAAKGSGSAGQAASATAAATVPGRQFAATAGSATALQQQKQHVLRQGQGQGLQPGAATPTPTPVALPPLPTLAYCEPRIAASPVFSGGLATSTLPLVLQQQQHPPVAALQPEPVQWLARDASAHRPIKRVLLPKAAARPELDVARLRLSAAAPLIAAQALGSPPTQDAQVGRASEARLLRCIFGAHFPARW